MALTHSRRDALKRLGAVALGVAATGCTPSAFARMLYPEADRIGDAALDHALQAFVLTVIPGAERPDVVARAFADPSLKLAPFRRVLVADLARRAAPYGAAAFEHLDADQRTRVIASGLEEGGVAGRLYNGAVFLTQAVYYSGLWNSTGSCPAIGFECPYQGNDGPVGHPDPESFLPASLTTAGNPA
jgi:hypothetical protein